jgi:DNA-binding GntR family transcriptional regulator
MLDAVRARDGEALVKAIERHFDEVRAWLADQLAEAADQASAADAPAELPRR